MKRTLAMLLGSLCLFGCASAPRKPLLLSQEGLFQAVRAHDAVTVQALMEAGIDPRIPDAKGILPLNIAANLGDSDVALALLHGGAPIRGVTGSGMTALISAAVGGRLEMAELLMDWGVDRDARTKKGRSAIDCAMASGYPALAEAIRQRGVAEPKPRYIPRPVCDEELQAWQRWAFACSAMPMELSAEACIGLGGNFWGNAPAAQKDLEKHWKLYSQEGALEKLQWLADLGDRAQYQTDLYRIQEVGLSTLKKLQAKGGSVGLRLSQRYSKADEARRKCGEQGILAWDLVRMIRLCSYAYAAGYIGEDDAWERIRSAACQLQSAFGSWKELHASYLAGYDYAAMGGEHARLKAAGEFLLLPENGESPWIKLPWGTDLEMASE